jgi:CheY-like chemotaxis protein
MRCLLPDLPVLVVTGNRDVDRQRAMLDGGAKQLLSKPFTADALAVALSSMLVPTTGEGRVQPTLCSG